MMAHPNRQSGFTLIEVLISIVIFALSIFAITQSRTTSLRNTLESDRMFEAVQLAESKMNEMQMKYQAMIDKGGLEGNFATEEGKFEAPHDRYAWKLEFKESSIKFTRAVMEKFLNSLGVEKDEADDQADQQRLVLANLNKMVKDNFAELHVAVTWTEFGKKYSVPMVTHLVPTKPKIELTTVGEE